MNSSTSKGLRIPYIDLHSDTITALDFPKETLRKNNHRMVTIDAMKRGGTYLQCFSAYVPTGYYPKPFRDTIAWNRFIKIAMRKNILLRRHRYDLVPVLSSEDLSGIIPGKTIGLMFTIEDLGLIGSDLSHLTEAHNLGVRIASLTWNHENTLAYPNASNARKMKLGLKPLGFSAVEEMNRLCIIPDVSHLSDGGFWDVINTSTKPVVASHSNARAVTNHQRNLTDDMIKAIAEKGGVIGLNFAPQFLDDHQAAQAGSGTALIHLKEKEMHSRIEDMVRHALHILKVGGREVLAIGTDFDGISGKFEIDTPAGMPQLFAALEKAGFTTGELEDMCKGNVLRVFKETGI